MRTEKALSSKQRDNVTAPTAPTPFPPRNLTHTNPIFLNGFCYWSYSVRIPAEAELSLPGPLSRKGTTVC